MVFGWINEDPTYQYVEESEFKLLSGAKILQPWKWSPMSGGMDYKDL